MNECSFFYFNQISAHVNSRACDPSLQLTKEICVVEPSLPPLQEISDMAGVQLPEYLGKVKGQTTAVEANAEASDIKKGQPKTQEG